MRVRRRPGQLPGLRLTPRLAHSSFKRILLPPPGQAPLFCDVILADILTSFAKVLGDLVVSACQIWGGGVSRGRIRMDGLKGWAVLAMVS